ncbi:MAG: response regulator [Planctomycetota bacterium]|jgi:CheY-like chemotaxis protein
MHRVCFIDDDQEFEIPLFREVFGDIFDVVTATSYVDLKSRIESLESWNPDLVVLDLYFPSGPMDGSAIEHLEAAPMQIENDNAQIRPAYRNFVKAQARLKDVLRAHKQGPSGGLELAGKIAVAYPKVPIVFYSRKATIEDVIRCMAVENVWSVERKPTGRDQAETVKLTDSAKGRLVASFESVIERKDLQSIQKIKSAAKCWLTYLQTLS